MPSNTTDPEHVAQQARQRLEADVEARVAAVRHVADAARDADEKDAAARTAAAAHSAAWAAALGAGWSDRDLRQIGLRAPAATAPNGGRRRNRPQAEPGPEG